MKKYLIFYIAAMVAVVACITVWFVMRSIGRNEPVAEVILNGEAVERVRLSEDREFTVDCGNGYNTIIVENGSIRVSEADCPDKVCVRTGAISGGAVPIVCLPHRLEIRIVDGEGGLDGGL